MLLGCFEIVVLNTFSAYVLSLNLKLPFYLDLISLFSCINDAVSVYDGDSISSSVLTVICGDQFLPTGLTTQVRLSRTS